ncbi:phospholipase D-like domain-containing protein [Tissierella creatinophila]|uniref:Cardiolipin synthase n=1 Tax=Tissierella creatinophila DSM 6911 TaxID=1123403 RepID=A0A1U7M5T1_TISCR|nr:phosphatidylserine/phosphatidylglycerophosphate/cardiolipin synthase family protein [Tissierella creatinophila]OLS02684.1 cardiolipin synthase [Tissierella creatinophila DSM 6911]
MKKLLRILLVILTVYLLYAFVFSLVIYAFENPTIGGKDQTPSDNQDNKTTRASHRVQLIASPQDALTARIKLIESANKTLDIAYFTFRNGETSLLMLGSIIDAADRGVEVRILLDGMSSLSSLTSEFLPILYAANAHEKISFKFYDPINPLFPFNWSKRLHDKMIISDDYLGIMGGRNIADNYFLKPTRWTTFSNDRDVLIYIDKTKGDYPSVITDMKNYYQETWDYKYSKPFRRKLSAKKLLESEGIREELKVNYLNSAYVSPKNAGSIDWLSHTMLAQDITFVHNPVGVINQDPWCLRALLSLSAQAKDSIFMQSPYIIPTRRMKSVFKDYDIDLEKTHILTNSTYSSPNHLSISAYQRHRNTMAENKVTIHEFQGEGSLHAKTYIFDDTISVLGSFNLDARSSYINSESMLVISSKEFASKLKGSIQGDLDKSLIVDPDASYRFSKHISPGEVGKLKQVVITVLAKITPILEHIL